MYILFTKESYSNLIYVDISEKLVFHLPHVIVVDIEIFLATIEIL